MKTFSELCVSVKDQCDPSRSGASVYVGLEHIDSGSFFLNRHGKPSDVRSSKARFRKGDVLYGKLRPYLDKAIIAPVDGICSTDILVFRPKSDCCAAYLLGLIHSAEFRTHADQTTNGVNHPRTSWHGLAGFTWNVPSKPEQEKIGAALWKVQRAIEIEAKLIAAARELKKSTMSQVFTYGLRNEPQKDTDVGRIPKSWQVCSLATIAKLERGRFMHRPRNEPRFYGGKTPFVQTGDVVRSQGWIRNHTQTLTEEGVLISRIFPRGTILITIAANIGFTGVLDYDCACPDSLVGITPNKEVDNWFLEYYLQTQQPEMDRQAPKGTQKNINIQFLTPWPAIVPTFDEQKEIATILLTIDKKILVHERKHEALSDLFQTMLHELIGTRIRVDKLDIDTREVAALNP